MNKNTASNPNTQMLLFDYHPDADYPLDAAEKFEFPLARYDTEKGRYYHAAQWVAGLGAKSKSAWRKLKKQLVNSNHQLDIQELPFEAADGKTYQVEFISEQSCYHVAQTMRVTKDNPQLKEIQEYLAKSGCFVNWANQNPDEAIEILKPLAARKREKQIGLHQQWGLEETAESRHYQARHENIEVYKQLQSAIARVCDNPQFGILTNAEYMAIFGETTDNLRRLLHSKSIRDSLTTRQIRAITFAEDTLRDIISEQRILTNDDILAMIDEILPPIGAMLKSLMNAQGLDHVTGKPLLVSGH